MNSAIAIGGGIAAAASFASSSVLQQRAARRTPASESLSWRLLADLARRSGWLAGMGCIVLAFGLESLALAFGPVGLVEPLIATELVFALPLAMYLGHRRLGRREWLGAAAVAGGVAMFIAVASPAGGNPEPALVRWLLVAGPAAAVATVALLAGRTRPETPSRAVLLAVAAATLAAVMALVTQSFVVLLSKVGLAGTLESWQPYVLAVCGAGTMTVSQSAFQSAPLAVSLPVLDSVEPVVAILMATIAFRQRIAASPLDLVLEALGAGLALLGIVALARSPLVHSIYEQQQEKKQKKQKRRQPAAGRASGDVSRSGSEAPASRRCDSAADATSTG